MRRTMSAILAVALVSVGALALAGNANADAQNADIVNGTICAEGQVNNGVAHAVNSDCIVVRSNACMLWSYVFDVPTGDNWGYRAQVHFGWSAGWSLPLIRSEESSSSGEMPDINEELSIEVTNQAGSNSGSSSGSPLGKLIDPSPIIDVEGDREVISDNGITCFGLGIGFWKTTATAAGSHDEYYCDNWGNCWVTRHVPWNRVDAPGTAVSVS